jgi:hypothetical protein
MEDLGSQKETGRPTALLSPTYPMMSDQHGVAAWRPRIVGTKIIFSFTLATFASGIMAAVMLYFKTLPPARPIQFRPGQGRYSAIIAQESEPEVTWLSSQLGLSKAQSLRIEPLVDEEQEKIDRMLADSSLSDEERISEIGQIRLATLDHLSTVLTENQCLRLQQLRTQEQAELSVVWEQAARGGE